MLLFACLYQYLSIFPSVYTLYVSFADNPMTSEQYHQQYNPPVEGSYTGINKQEKVVPVMDQSNDREQVQQR